MGRRARTVLLPSERLGEGPLPLLVPILAIIALAILCFTVIPATLEDDALVQRHQATQRAAHKVQDELQRRRTQLRAGQRDTFGRMRRLRRLETQGRRYLRQRAASLAHLRRPAAPRTGAPSGTPKPTNATPPSRKPGATAPGQVNAPQRPSPPRQRGE